MITIENNQIRRDSEKIGQIVGTVAWMNSRQAGRIIGQIKQAANIEGLTFEIVDTPEEKASLEAVSGAEDSSDTPTDKDSLTVEPLSAPEVVDNPPASEPVASRDDLAAGIPEPCRRPSLGDKDPIWQRWYIATYGEDAFKTKWPARKLPN